ncbi:MAG: ATP-binding cassette domain-containing protein [Verrucomicrobia bacterium]|jgi:ABC-type transporter Mla maintaining outer membrane lipid asymmetry ATPase subunit MlaF|nr:ATP-binding cassette domain-containing protein [Verrucomicrobiota bacterium]
MKPTPVLELAAVAIQRADEEELLLENIHWRVEPGDWWVIAGGHGSGKSMLLQSLAGLIPLAQGTLSVFGESYSATERRPTGWRQRVGLVFESGGRLLRELTVAENIALPVGYHRNCSPAAALETVLPLIQALDLERLADAPAGRIGRAWAQRVALARALALGPELLLLDNPLTGMDQNHLRWWRQFLPQLRAGHPVLGGRGLTLIVTTDNLRSWLGAERQFAVVHHRQLRPVGFQNQLEAAASEYSDWLQPD